MEMMAAFHEGELRGEPTWGADTEYGLSYYVEVLKFIWEHEGVGSLSSQILKN